MKNHSNTLFWILTDTLLILGFVFFPSFFSFFAILMAIVFAPIDSWQELLNKFLKKPIKAAVIALGIALVISLFPLSTLVTGVYKLANPEVNSPNATSSVINYEEFPSVSSNSSTSEDTHSETNSTSDVSSNSSKKDFVSSKVSTSSKKPNQSSSTSSVKVSSTNKEPSKSDMVYRTPNGKRYHYSASCGGKNSYEVTYTDATNDGLTPCKKCVK